MFLLFNPLILLEKSEKQKTHILSERWEKCIKWAIELAQFRFAIQSDTRNYIPKARGTITQASTHDSQREKGVEKQNLRVVVGAFEMSTNIDG